MDRIDRMILDRIQRSFPLVPEPFFAIGKDLNISASETINRIKSLKDRKILRQISAIFNTGALGYKSSLVAMSIEENQLEKTVSVINAYPGVSHNYLRPAKFNLWFTLAVPPKENLESVVKELARKAGNVPFLILPAIKKYKLAVVLDMLEGTDEEGTRENFTRKSLLESPKAPFIPDKKSIKIVRCVQEDMPLVNRPFKEWALSIDMKEESLINILNQWLKAGLIRRFAALLNHREAGFVANSMIVWRCPEDRIDKAGEKLASFPEVSHCYHRPAYPEWPYNLYAMIHGRTMEECKKKARKLAEAIEIIEYEVLFSVKEFKKVRLKLFWE